MLEIVSKGFKNAKAALTGHAVLTEANIDEAVREIRVSLLEADVELGVVRRFIERVKERAIGEVVPLSAGQKGGKKIAATPGEHFVLICHNELEKLMGPTEETPIVYRRPYTIIMMVGLQGTGKTTTCGKLARYLLQQKRRPMLVAADIYRPAAVEQLRILGSQLNVPVYAQEGVPPPQLCEDALREAKRKKCDVVIFDTAGRLAIDDALMHELELIKSRTKPDNIFLVCDAMAGQDTVNTASIFNRRLDLTGFIMTKLDGDARGGAALSIKDITGKSIKFLGMGEGLDKLEPFRPEGLASRILGMGDVVGLMKDFEQVIDEKQAERDAKKLLKGQFTLEDFLSQIKMLQKVGSLTDIYEKFPIFGDGGMPEGAKIDNNAFGMIESLIQSMTPEERRTPQIINDSRAKRIARGSGRTPEEVKDLIARFGMMHTMMANLTSQPGLLGMMPGIKQLSQLRKLKGKGMDDILGGGGQGLADMLMGGGGGRGALPGGGFPAGLPTGLGRGTAAGMGGMMGGGMPPGLPPGVTPQQYAAAMQAYQQHMGMGGSNKPRALDLKSKEKSKSKRKAQKEARKRARR